MALSLSLKQIVLAGVVALSSVFAIYRFLTSEQELKYSYIGSDYPSKWSVALGKVHKASEDTVHYALDTDVGTMEWTSILPSGGGMLYFGDSDSPFSISMFHQLRCLDIVGHELKDRLATHSRARPSDLAQHCMNYLRQMVLCRADTTLESATNPYGPHIVVPGVTHTCNDWTAVYAAAEANHARRARNLSL